MKWSGIDVLNIKKKEWIQEIPLLIGTSVGGLINLIIKQKNTDNYNQTNKLNK